MTEAESAPPSPARPRRRAGRQLAIGAVLLLVVAGIAVFQLVPGSPAAVELSPSEDLLLTPTASLQFSARVTDARGRLVEERPAWSSDGSISDAGLFTAPERAGAYYVQAAAGPATAVVHVLVTAGPAKTVRVMPEEAVVKPRESVRLSVKATDTWGNELTVPAFWRVAAGAGSIDGDGLFLAGRAGTSRITAEIQSVAAGATITAACPAPRAETTAGVSFTLACAESADVHIGAGGLSAQAVTETVDTAVAAVEKSFGRVFERRLEINVFPTKDSFDNGVRQLLHAEPTPGEEGIFAQPNSIVIDWGAPESPEAIVRHEVTHALIATTARRGIPLWANEGLATLHEFPVSESAALASRYCTASAAMNGRLPNLGVLATSQDWASYIGDVGPLAYAIAGQLAAFAAEDANGSANLVEKLSTGLTFDAAYAAASGRTYDSFVAGLPARARALAERSPGVATSGRLFDGSTVYVSYGQPGGSRVSVDVRNDRFFGGGTDIASYFGCAIGFLRPTWPAGTFTISVSGPNGGATGTLRR